MLVVQAQPTGTALLSIADEEQRIRHLFQPLIDAGLLEIDVLAHVTADGSTSESSRARSRAPYDIVHFIGHGDSLVSRMMTTAKDNCCFMGRMAGRSGDIQTLREILCNRGIQIVFLTRAIRRAIHADSSIAASGKR